MSDQITLTVPDIVTERARRIAETTDQAVEQVLIEQLQRLSPLWMLLPDNELAEIEALQFLSDDALWTMAREQLPADVQKRAHELMEKNARLNINEDELIELDMLVERADRVMMRKAEAADLLRKRGHHFLPVDFLAAHD